MRTYFLGVMLGGGVRGIHETASHKRGTAAIYATTSLDELPSEISLFLGERITTKANLRRGNSSILEYLQERYPDRNLQRVVVV